MATASDPTSNKLSSISSSASQKMFKRPSKKSQSSKNSSMLIAASAGRGSITNSMMKGPSVGKGQASQILLNEAGDDLLDEAGVEPVAVQTIDVPVDNKDGAHVDL